ncbi:hypothetical protein CFD03_15135, partial [Salmonella enterica subsp. enterica serovar Meleagridis]|nr:hypothetical protein [Salmonella enterica subsp. enterica serovar Meleagridis]
ENSELRQLYFIIKKIYHFIALGILVIGLLFFLLLNSIVNASISPENLYITWGVFVISTSLSYLYSAQSVILTADQNVYLVKLITGLTRSLAYILQIFLMICGVSFWIVCAIELLSNVIQLILFNKLTLKKYPQLVKLDITDTINKENIISVKSKIKREIKYTFVHKIAGVVVFNTDYLIISVFLGITVITSFSSYMMLIQALAFLISAIASPLGAYIGAKLYSDSKEKVIRIISLYNSLFFMLGIFCAYMFYISSSTFVSLWMGKEIVLSQQLVLLLSVNCFVLIARISFDVAKVGLGYMSDVELPLLEAIINIIVSLVLVHYLGLNGIVIGTIVSNIIVVMILKPVFLYKNALKSDNAFIIHELIRSWFFISIFLLSIFFITRAKVIVSNEWLDFFIQVCMSSITPLLLLIMIYSVFDSNVRKFMFVMFKKKV